MPHISISLYPGRSSEMKAEMAEKVVSLLVESYNWRPEDISVSLEEISADSYKSIVNEKINNEELLIESDFIKEKR